MQNSLKTATNDSSHSQLDEQKSIIRQYVPGELSQLNNGEESANESNFRSLVDGFLSSQESGLPRSNASIDLLVTIFCFISMHAIYLGSLDFSSSRTIALISSVVFLGLALLISGTYNTKNLRSLNNEVIKLSICWICAFAAIGLFAFLTKTAGGVSRFWITTSMVLTYTSLVSIRIFNLVGWFTGNNLKARNVVVFGDVKRINSVMDNLYQPTSSRFQVASVFEFAANSSSIDSSSNSLTDASNQIIEYVEQERQTGTAIEQVWIAVSNDQSNVVEKLSQALRNSSVDVCVVPDTQTERLIRGEATRIGETRVVNISEVSLSPAADQFKRVFDVFFASIATLMLCIPMAIIACLIKLESPGPVLFRQKRYGVDGADIEVLKFRSMHVHSDSTVKQATREDARVTRVGKIIRRTSLDELPQLLNVLQGTMSLVGPRPHASYHNEIWRDQIEGYMLRHKVRPGITGWAQVNGWRGETDTVYKMQQRVEHDLEYIKNWSPLLDVKIMFFTVISLACDKNAY